LGSDNSVTLWTQIGADLNPSDLTVFNGALWFVGSDTTTGRSQLYKLGNDGSVTQWTAVGTNLFPAPVSAVAGDTDSTPLSTFNNALWFEGHTAATGTELYKLGADGSFTFWNDINPGPNSSSPKDWAVLGS
jgi:hypothetical protein